MIFWSESTIPEHQRLSVFILKNPVSDHYFFNHFFGGFGGDREKTLKTEKNHFFRFLPLILYNITLRDENCMENSSVTIQKLEKSDFLGEIVDT